MNKLIFHIIILAILLSIPVATNAQIGLHSDLNGDGVDNISDVSYHISIIMGHTTDAAVNASLCPNTLHPHVIDLGLPSGTKWTCCNIGAKDPLEYGDHYAWGEMLAKDFYSKDNYCYYDVDQSSCHNIGDDIAGTNYDVATIRWGNKYSMPSNDQFQELVDNCTYSWTTIGGVNGALFTASNGNKIFLPAAGNYMDKGFILGVGSIGYYWASNQSTDATTYAYEIDFDDDDAYPNSNWYRYSGLSIRPVSH